MWASSNPQGSHIPKEEWGWKKGSRVSDCKNLGINREQIRLHECHAKKDHAHTREIVAQPKSEEETTGGVVSTSKGVWVDASLLEEEGDGSSKCH